MIILFVRQLMFFLVIMLLGSWTSAIFASKAPHPVHLMGEGGAVLIEFLYILLIAVGATCVFASIFIVIERYWYALEIDTRKTFYLFALGMTILLIGYAFDKTQQKPILSQPIHYSVIK